MRRRETTSERTHTEKRRLLRSWDGNMKKGASAERDGPNLVCEDLLLQWTKWHELLMKLYEGARQRASLQDWWNVIRRTPNKCFETCAWGGCEERWVRFVHGGVVSVGNSGNMISECVTTMRYIDFKKGFIKESVKYWEILPRTFATDSFGSSGEKGTVCVSLRW